MWFPERRSYKPFGDIRSFQTPEPLTILLQVLESISKKTQKIRSTLFLLGVWGISSKCSNLRQIDVYEMQTMVFHFSFKFLHN